MAQPLEPFDGLDRLLIGTTVAPVWDNAYCFGFQVVSPVNPVAVPGYCAAVFERVMACFFLEKCPKFQAAPAKNVHIALTVSKKFCLKVENLALLAVVPRVKRVSRFWLHGGW